MDENLNNQTPGQPPQDGGGSAGSLIAIIVVLALIIVGALFFWQRSDEPADEVLEAISTQSDSDAAADIETDLEATDIESIDAELNNL